MLKIALHYQVYQLFCKVMYHILIIMSNLRIIGWIENTDIDNEVAADLVGEYLFNDEKFLDTLSKKPTLIQKIKSLIDDLVIRFKGTNEEKQLRSIQKKFQEMYQNNDVLNQEKGIKLSLGEIDFKPTKYDLEKGKYLDYNTNSWKDIPHELVSYISVEPKKAKYLSYSTAESFYELDISEMDKAIAESEPAIFESLKNHQYNGSFNTDNYSFEYVIFDEEGMFGIVHAKKIGSEVEEVVNEGYTQESSRYNEEKISEGENIGNSKLVGYSRGSTATPRLDETTGYREVRGTRHIGENTRNTKEVKYSLSNKELDNSSFHFDKI